MKNNQSHIPLAISVVQGSWSAYNVHNFFPVTCWWWTENPYDGSLFPACAILTEPDLNLNRFPVITRWLKQCSAHSKCAIDCEYVTQQLINLRLFTNVGNHQIDPRYTPETAGWLRCPWRPKILQPGQHWSNRQRGSYLHDFELLLGSNDVSTSS